MRLYFILLLLLISNFSFAQQDRDYYVTVNLDTVYGKVKVNKADFSLTKFKKPGEDYQIISGEVIRFYDAIAQESYARLEIVKGSPSFYIEEIAGSISLLISPQHYYLVDRQGRYAEALRNRKLTPEQYGISATAIKNLLTDCGLIGEREIKALYSEGEIVYLRLYDLLRRYNECINPTVTEVPLKKKESVLSMEIMAVLGRGEKRPSIFNGGVFEYADIKNSSFTQFQGRVKMGYSPRTNRLNFIIGYSRSSYQDEGASSRLEGDLLVYRYTDSWDVSLNLIDVSFGLEYCFFIAPRFSVYPTVGHSMVKTDIEEFYLKEVRALTNGFVLNTSHYYLKNNSIQREFAPSFFYGMGVEYKITYRLRSILEFVQYTPVTIHFDPGANRPELEFKRNSLRLGLGFMLIKG